MADLESPLGLVVGGRCPCSLPRCGWLHCRPLSGSAAFPINAWCGQPKADHFGPINRKGEAVSSKARPGLLFGFSWLRADITSNGPAPRFRELYVQW